jgi:hypothetical protein
MDPAGGLPARSAADAGVDGGASPLRGDDARARGDGAFRIPGPPVLPALYILALAAVAAHVVFTEPRLALAGTLILLTGWPLFLVGRRLSRASAAR